MEKNVLNFFFFFLPKKLFNVANLSVWRMPVRVCCDWQVSRWYDLVVFTASMEIYGAAIADKLDNNRGILKTRYYRQVSTRPGTVTMDTTKVPSPPSGSVGD